MKRTLWLLAGCLVFLLTGCDKNNKGPEPGPVSQQAKEALAIKYPGAAGIVWETKNEYVVAHFSMASSKAADNATGLSAWFDNEGNWYMTETDISFDDLPEPVSAAFLAGEFARWKRDDVDKLERNGTETVYVIEVESINNGVETEVDLYYSPDGVLVKKITDAQADYDYEDYIPSKPAAGVNNYLNEHYPGARILEIDYEKGMTEVEILDGRVCRELLFDQSENWVYTKTETDFNNVPNAVKQALEDNGYGSYHIDDIDYYQSAKGDYYRFELESVAGDVKVDITSQGALSIVTPGEDNTESNGSMLDQAITDFINGKYSGARIIEYDFDDGFLEVEIYHDSREKKAYFNGSNAWVKTEWDVQNADLPVSVTNAVEASQWKSYRIDDIEYVQTPAAEYYRLELESGYSEVTLNIDATGKIL